MESAPPSYDASTTPDPMRIVAHYLDTRALRNAVLVCRAWNISCSPRLWGDPGLHFAAQGKHDVHDARRGLTRLQRVLPLARFSVRQLVHTIHLQALAGVYDVQASPDWIRALFEQLPHLQNVDLSGLMLVDHASLYALQGPAISSTRFIRLLDLSDCSNATSKALCTALERFSQLVYLDLSRITSVRDSEVITIISQLQLLKVLKLQEVGLGDHEVANLLRHLPRSIRSLNLSSNPRLTDDSFIGLIEQVLANRAHRPAVVANDLEQQTYRSLMSGHVGSLLIEEELDTGVTHLNLAKTSISLRLARRLIFVGCLQMLDVGDLRSSVSGRPFDGVLPGNTSTLKQLRLSLLLSSVFSLQESDADVGQVLDLGAFPDLETLSITQVPAFAQTDSPARILIALIRACAIQARVGSLQGRLSAISRNTTKAGRNLLQELYIEVLSPKALDAEKSMTWNHGMTTRSVTEDNDSEMLWTAAETDFSFFSSSSRPRSTQNISPRPLKEFDIVKMVSAFRQNVREQQNNAVRRGEVYPKIDGYWPGQVKVIRM